MTIEEIKTDLKAYCRERNVCADGYADLLRAETPADLWAILKEHIIGMQSDLLCDYISEHLQAWYDAFGDEARQQGIYLNENVRGAMVLVNRQTDFAATEEADVVLAGHSRSEVQNCRVVVRERATATITDCQRAECREAATVRLMSGTLIDHGHLSITAYNGSTVYSISTKKITLVAGATVKLLEE